jgi:hypothetical protein
MWYLSELHNPNKHPMMQVEYPWKVSNTFIAGYTEVTQAELDELLLIDCSAYLADISISPAKKIQIANRKFGQSIVNEVIDMMGEKNHELEISGVIVDMVGLATDNAGIKLLLETGAVGTAAGLSSMLKVKYPEHASVYDYLITKVQAYLLNI